MAIARTVRSRTVDLGERFRPQREWSEGRGLLLIVAHFLTGTGAGCWLFAVIFNLAVGLPIGLLLVIMGAGTHLLFLGRPERFWRMMTRSKSSWISRGFVGMTLFIPIAMAYLLILYGGLPDALVGQIVLVISLVGAAWIVVYKGFVWASSKGIPLWNTPLVPALYMVYALRGGAAILMILLALGGGTKGAESLESAKLWLAVSTAVLVLIYVEVMRGSGITALRSINLMLVGRIAPLFYLGVALIGLLIPIVIGGLIYGTSVSPELVALAASFSLLGDLSVIYCIAKAGLYRPLPV